MKERRGNSTINTVLIAAIILVIASSGFAVYRIISKPSSGVSNTNTTALNHVNSNTNEIANISTSSNANTAPCDYSKVAVQQGTIVDLPVTPSGWARFTPSSGHFTVNMPKVPDASQEQTLFPDSNNPYLTSFYQY